MKILRLSTFLDFGGVETRLANVSHVRDENEWIFVCLNKEGKAAKKIKENGKRVINLEAKPSIYSLSSFWKVFKIIKKEKPDVIHTSGAEANFHGILAAKLAGVKRIIGEEIGTPSHSRKAQLIFSNIYKWADFVVGNSVSVLNVVHKIDKVPFEKLVKIDNPIIFRNLEVYSDQTNKTDAFSMVMISRLEPVKNIEGVLKVVKRLKNNGKEIQLSIAGTGSMEEELKSCVKKLEIKENVRFLGLINDPYPYLLKADLYILNSHSEGFSNSLVEAMYSKTPALSTEVGAAPEIIEDGKNGFLVSSNDSERLYEKLIEIISLSKDYLEKIGISGHEKIVKNFSLDNHVKELMKIYNI